MDSNPQALDEAPPLSRLRASVLWAGLIIAFSPALAHLAQHLADRPWAWYAGLFPALFAVSLLRQPAEPERHADGLWWIAAGLVVEMVAAFFGVMRFGRLGFVLGAIGLCRRFGLAGPRGLVLLALAIPLPETLMKLASTSFVGAMLDLAASALGSIGLGAEVDASMIGGVDRISPATFRVNRLDSGIALCPLLAGLSWYESLLRRHDLARSLGRAIAWSLAALPIQFAGMVAALLAVGADQPLLGRHVLTHGPWIAIASARLLQIELDHRRAGRQLALRTGSVQ